MNNNNSKLFTWFLRGTITEDIAFLVYQVFGWPGFVLTSLALATAVYVYFRVEDEV